MTAATMTSFRGLPRPNESHRLRRWWFTPPFRLPPGLIRHSVLNQRRHEEEMGATRVNDVLQWTDQWVVFSSGTTVVTVPVVVAQTWDFTNQLGLCHPEPFVACAPRGQAPRGIGDFNRSVQHRPARRTSAHERGAVRRT